MQILNCFRIAHGYIFLISKAQRTRYTDLLPLQATASILDRSRISRMSPLEGGWSKKKNNCHPVMLSISHLGR